MNKKIICVDLDGVILSYKKSWLGADVFGNPNPGIRTLLKKLINDNWWVIVYTCRGNTKKLESMLNYYGIYKKVHYSSINRRKNVWKGTSRCKIGADIYLDDRSITFTGDCNKAYRDIKKFRPWQNR